MQTEVDFSERSLAKHLSDFVKFQLSLWSFVVFSEAILNELHDHEHFLRSGTQLLILRILDSIDNVFSYSLLRGLLIVFL